MLAGGGGEDVGGPKGVAEAGDDEEDPEMKGGKKAAKPTPEQIGIIIDEDFSDELIVTKKHKKVEFKDRDTQLRDLDGKIRAL